MTIEEIGKNYYWKDVLPQRVLGGLIDIAILFLLLGVTTVISMGLIHNRILEITLVVIIVGYFQFFEMQKGKTPGKMLTKIRIVNFNGDNPFSVQVLIRTVFRIIEVNPVFLGALPAGLIVLLTPKKQRAGDIVAKTFVLRDKDLVTEQ